MIDYRTPPSGFSRIILTIIHKFAFSSFLLKINECNIVIGSPIYYINKKRIINVVISLRLRFRCDLCKHDVSFYNIPLRFEFPKIN